MAAFEIHYSSPRRHRLLRFPPGLGWGEKGGGGLERNERGRGERESGRRRVRNGWQGEEKEVEEEWRLDERRRLKIGVGRLERGSCKKCGKSVERRKRMRRRMIRRGLEEIGGAVGIVKKERNRREDEILKSEK